MLAAAITLAIAVAISLIAVRIAGLVYLGRTMGGLTTVHDDTRVMGERIRVLEVEGTYQSATYLDSRWADPVFPYHRLFDHLFDAWPDGSGPHTVAVLGGGGYAIPKHLIVHHPQIDHVDVIEIDPRIERIARKHFFVGRLERLLNKRGQANRLRLHVDDARSWLEGCEDTFDAIVNDCFTALAPEATLMDESASRLIATRLSPDGVYLTNVVSALHGPNAQTLHDVADALQTVFAHVWVYPCGASEPTLRDNNVVIATDRACDFPGAWPWPFA